MTMYPMSLPSKLRKLLRRSSKRKGSTAEKFESRVEAIANVQELEFEIVDRCNTEWRSTGRGARLTFQRNPILKKNHKVMTIGSCFAQEIKRELRERGFDVYPKYSDIEFDPQTQKVAKLPEVDDINHYDTFTIRAEFERAFSGESYSSDSFLKHVPRLGRIFAGAGKEVWQDPYRRHVYADSEAKLLDLSQKVDRCIREAVAEADMYVITPGVTEAWRNDSNGRYINQAPMLDRSGRAPGFTFVKSSFADNYNNLHKICSLIAERYPQKKIVLTVSPVPLKRTFTDRDVVIANTDSKSLLRTVASEISRDFPNVIYWPSYEIALARDFFQKDGRHLNPAVVQNIVHTFIKVHSEA